MTDVAAPLLMHQDSCSVVQPLAFLLPSGSHQTHNYHRRADFHRSPLSWYARRPSRPSRMQSDPALSRLSCGPSVFVPGTLEDGVQSRPETLAAPLSTMPLHGHGTSSTSALKLPLPPGPYPSTQVSFTGSQSGRTAQPGPVRPSSPLAKPAPPPTAAERALRKKSAEDHAIVPSLQIPPTINDSKGSLAEFAAQITCLFWFESYFLLRTVEEAQDTPLSASRLVPESHPSIGFRKWATTILSTTQVTQNVILLALLFIYRLKKQNPTVKGKSGSEFRLLTVALMLGNKFLDDNTYTNKTWAEVSGISVQEIHIMEVEFLSNMKYSLFVSESEWREWHVKLGRFWNYFEHASRAAPLEPSRRPSGPPTPTLKLSPSLPTPPASTRTSPPYGSTYTPNPLGYPHTSTMPTSLGPYFPTPTTRVSELDYRLAPRKRSRDDSGQEPPAKRIASAVHPNSALGPLDLLASSRQTGMLPNAPGLPAPNPSFSTARSTSDLYPNMSAPQPLPNGRAMSLIYGSQAASTTRPPVAVSSAAVAHTQPVMHSFPSGSDELRRQSTQYPVTSVASPASAFYSAPTTSQSNLSPSYILTHRNSPYRPVREVSTLLVPPQSGIIHGGPQQLAYDQMHYQPLGKARNEYRTGVVPYVHQDAWPNMQQVLSWPAVSQPSSTR